MGLRSRLKNRLKRTLGGETPAPQAPPPAAAAPRAPAPVAPVAPVAPPVAPPLADAAPVTPETAEEAERAEKAAAHLEKTKRAVLRFVGDAGGVSSLGDMHDYSERRWFVGHKKFSDLMEGLVADALIDYDGAEGRAMLTEAGRDYLVENPPPKRK